MALLNIDSPAPHDQVCVCVCGKGEGGREEKKIDLMCF